MDSREIKILEALDFGYKILGHGHLYGYDNPDEYNNVLKKMKSEGLINFRESSHPIFKGDPEGIVTITSLGKSKLSAEL